MRAAAVLAMGLVLVMSTLMPAKRPNDYIGGMITDIDYHDEWIVVEGVTVQATASTVILKRICGDGGGGGGGEVVEIPFGDLAVGQTVQVSGLYVGDVLFAKKIMVRFAAALTP